MERLSPGDLTVLASDAGPVPMQIAAVLTVAASAQLTRAELAAVLWRRVPEVPRLRQRLVRPRWGVGRTYWVDDPAFDVQRHIVTRTAADEQQLWDVAAEQVCARLEESRPLWRACLVDDGQGGTSGVVIVTHHVLADGLGGLAVLGALADQAPPAVPAPVPPTGTARARAQTWGTGTVRGIRHSVAGVLHTVRRSLAGLRELGLGRRPRLAARTSLNRPTGTRRRLARVRVPLADVKRAAHRAGGTVNDVVVSAVVGALADVLHGRREHLDVLVVSVPVSARPRTDARNLGNQVGVRPLRVPVVADDHERLSALVALRRTAAAAPPASSAGPLGLMFRTLARLGLFQWFIDRQRLVHTFVTNVRGPEQHLYLAGHEITSITPVAVNPGNVTVSFDVLSYAGELGVTIVVDPERVPELAALTQSLQHRLLELTDVA